MSNDYESDADRSLIVPSNSDGDVAHAVVNAMIGSIPILGAAGQALFNLVISPPVERRRDELLNNLADAVGELQQKHPLLNYGALRDNPRFITAVMHAAQIASRSHQEEKLEALRNAVLNSALPNAPEDDVQAMFLDCVDALTPWHLRLLKLIADPPAWFTANGKKWTQTSMGSMMGIVGDAYPDLKAQQEFTNQLVRELYARGLASTESLGGTVSAQGLTQSRTTAFGNRFLRFIEKPE